MFTYNFKYEFKSLVRSKWLLLLTIILLILVLFAGFNGKQKVEKRLANIEKITSEVATKDAIISNQLDSLNNGYSVNVNPRWTPENPVTIGSRNPRLAILPPNEISFISAGQSDLFTHFIQPSMFDNNFKLNFTELASPVQLLFGSFDIAFIIIYILPLIIIAFSYNVLSNEKEYGSLKLLGSQPISIFSWLLQKVGIRFFCLTAITVIVLIITFIINGFNFAENSAQFLSLILLITAYILFWFTITLAINILIGNSAKNAVGLLGIWVFIILMIPAIVSQFVNTTYPIPSRTKMLSEAREIEEEAAKKQDKILDNFLRDHPEYATKEGQIDYSFWHKYIATKKIVEDELQPLLDSYDNQLLQQQKWIKNWQYISPAVIMQQSFNNLAGTSTAHYQGFRSQVIQFSGEWKDYFTKMVYNNRTFTNSDFKNLPQFEYEQPKLSSNVLNTFIVIMFSLIIILISWIGFKKKTKSGSIMG